MIRLKPFLNKNKDTTTRPDEIHYQFIKHLPETSLNVLLSIYNDIWYSWKFPNSWLETTVISIPKPNNDPTNLTNYHSITLTGCICLDIKVDTDRTRILSTNLSTSKHLYTTALSDVCVLRFREGIWFYLEIQNNEGHVQLKYKSKDVHID